jgi:hypothetical protein
MQSPSRFLGNQHRPPRPTDAGPTIRRGSAVLEMVIVLPVLLLAGIGIMSFGLFFANKQQLALAARVGAEEASQTPLPTSNGDPIPSNIVEAVTAQLASSSIEVYEIRLEHNVGTGVTPAVLTWRPDGETGTCPCGPQTTLDPCPLLGQYVRLTVCVQLNELMPNMLANVGASVCGKISYSTSIFRHELP